MLSCEKKKKEREIIMYSINGTFHVLCSIKGTFHLTLKISIKLGIYSDYHINYQILLKFCHNLLNGSILNMIESEFSDKRKIFHFHNYRQVLKWNSLFQKNSFFGTQNFFSPKLWVINGTKSNFLKNLFCSIINT